MIKGYQIRAARALVDWSLKDLEQACGITGQSISNYETGRSMLNSANLEKVIRAFEAKSVEFTPTGAQIKTTPVYYYEGDAWYLDLLEDAYQTIINDKSPLIRIENVNDRKSSPAVIHKMRKLRNSGIDIRMTAQEGETFLCAPSNCYRFIPRNYFKNWVVLMFGDKTAFSIEKEARCMVIEDADMAGAIRNRFDLLWDILPELSIESTADERV